MFWVWQVTNYTKASNFCAQCWTSPQKITFLWDTQCVVLQYEHKNRHLCLEAAFSQSIFHFMQPLPTVIQGFPVSCSLLILLSQHKKVTTKKCFFKLSFFKKTLTIISGLTSHRTSSHQNGRLSSYIYPAIISK